MVDKKIQLKDLVTKAAVYPITKGKFVTNNAGADLGAVEAGAQVNVLEGVQLNGTDVAINNKIANIVLPDAVAYTIVRAETADEGYAATYQLAADGTAFGTKINIPKDMVVSAGVVKTCEEKDKPVAGLNVGDPYIELTIANATSDKIYIPCKDFVDVYTQGNGITITDHSIAIDDTVVVTHTELTEALSGKQGNLTEDQLAAANSGITQAKREGYDTHVADGDKHVTAELKATWSGKQDAIADLAEIRSNAAAGKSAADTIATYGTIVTEDADSYYTKTDIQGLGLLTYEVIEEQGE